MIEQPSIFFILAAFVAVLGPLVFFHELGHYGVARLFGVKCDAFSIGFGKEIFGWTDKRGMRWKVAMLPVGGYVKFAGDADAASRPGESNGDPDHFQNKPVWQRFLIVLAGPMANFLLAIVIFAAFFMAIGTAQSTSQINSVEPDSAAAAAGLVPGDEIVSIAGRDIASFDDIMRTVVIRPGEEVDIRYERDGEVRSTRTQLAAHVATDRYGQEFTVGRLGVEGSVERAAVGPIAAVGKGVTETWRLLTWIVDGLGRILFGNLSVKEIGGPIKMAQITGQQAQLGWEAAVGFAALLSINLGFINLLPVPMLDGGHLLFYAIEGIRRRPVSPHVQEWAFRGGLALLLALILFTTFNDLSSIGVADRIERLIG
ncbi:RIP metalloprotease RseP [Sphingomicrobium sp. XHP0239]|uniref:RIP metalloprotease RseP n=1 Tax=Sphingomicrobium maritimum TaxID=3133972 RepID=UPI0031CCCC88